MPTNFPASVDTTTELPNDRADATVQDDNHASDHNNLSDALRAVEDFLVNGGPHLNLGAGPYASAGALRLSQGIASVAATGLLAMPVQPAIGDTITIGGLTWTFVADGTANTSIGEINRGTDAASAQANLVAEFPDAFLTYPEVTISDFVADVATVTWSTRGTVGNSVATTSTFTDPANGFASATLTGGVDAVGGDVSIRNVDDDGDIEIVRGTSFQNSGQSYDLIRFGRYFAYDPNYQDQLLLLGGKYFFLTDIEPDQYDGDNISLRAHAFLNSGEFAISRIDGDERLSFLSTGGSGLVVKMRDLPLADPMNPYQVWAKDFAALVPGDLVLVVNPE